MSITVRAATESDQEAILFLARGERVKPVGLRWPNFVVAERPSELIGMAQLRLHPDGSHELGTLVVRRDCRNKGIAAMLINALLAKHTGRILMITGATFAHHYGCWGFEAVEPRMAPGCVRLNYWLGLYGGRLISLLRRRPFNRLAILDRAAT